MRWISGIRWLGVRYAPRTDERPFFERAQIQRDESNEVSVAVLDARESERFFRVPVARRGVQPVWLKITSGDSRPYRLDLLALDPSY